MPGGFKAVRFAENSVNAIYLGSDLHVGDDGGAKTVTQKQWMAETSGTSPARKTKDSGTMYLLLVIQQAASTIELVDKWITVYVPCT